MLLPPAEHERPDCSTALVYSECYINFWVILVGRNYYSNVFWFDFEFPLTLNEFDNFLINILITVNISHVIFKLFAHFSV